MKYLKQIGILTFALLSIVLSIKSGYAAENYNIVDITPTSTQTLEVELDQAISITDNKITSDLKIYKDISVKSVAKDSTDTKKIVMELDETLSKGESYSVLSILGVEGSIEFTPEDIEGETIQNSDLDGEDQGIESVIITDASTIELVFLKDLLDEEFEFKVYKDIGVDTLSKSEETTNINVVLRDALDDNSDYVGTVTLFEGDDLSKMDIDNGIYDFSTKALAKYESEVEAQAEEQDEDLGIEEGEKSLEETLLEALEGSDELNPDTLLEGELELNEELNAAAEDPENIEKTQLEELALSSSETPDTGAETWILILATFIINTFYFFSRRKARKMA